MAIISSLWCIAGRLAQQKIKNETFKAQYYLLKYHVHMTGENESLLYLCDSNEQKRWYCTCSNNAWFFVFCPKTITDNWILKIFAKDIRWRNRNKHTWDLRFALFCCGLKPFHNRSCHRISICSCYRYCIILVSNLKTILAPKYPLLRTMYIMAFCNVFWHPMHRAVNIVDLFHNIYDCDIGKVQ